MGVTNPTEAIGTPDMEVKKASKYAGEGKLRSALSSLMKPYRQNQAGSSLSPDKQYSTARSLG